MDFNSQTRQPETQLGNLKVIEALAQGGFGITYKMVHSRLGVNSQSRSIRRLVSVPAIRKIRRLFLNRIPNRRTCMYEDYKTLYRKPNYWPTCR